MVKKIGFRNVLTKGALSAVTALAISGMIPTTVTLASELQATEMIANVAVSQFNVTQGDTVHFQINLEANGRLDHDALVKVYTEYTIEGNTLVKGGEVEWAIAAGTGNRSKTVNATLTISKNANPAVYSSKMVANIINSNPNDQQIVKDNEADFLSINVNKAADTTPPTINFVNPLSGVYNANTLPNTFKFNLNEPSEVFVNGASFGQFDAGVNDLVLPNHNQGSNSVSIKAKDIAGNESEVSSFTYIYDSIAPIVKAQPSQEPNKNGWYNQNVNIHFDATDNGTGVESVSDDVTVDSEGEGQTVSGSATDFAGNIGTATIKLNIDKTLPTIKGSVDSQANSNGWYNHDVTISFEGIDELSGINTTTSPIVLSENGANQSANGTMVDKAGNQQSTTVEGINIDKNSPVITVENGGTYTLNQSVTWTAKDDLSGLDTSASGSIDTSTVGSKTQFITATDKAGNTTTKEIHYTVIYNYSGVLQPINSDGSSIFKAGSTVPVKFQLTDSKGNFISTANATIYYAKYSNQVLGNDVEAVSTSAATSGNQFRYDPSASQYIFNLSTKGLVTGSYQITIKLDDGKSYSVNIGLK